MREIFKLATQHKIIAFIAILTLILGGRYGYKSFFGKDGAVRYVFAQAEKGTFIVSVSGAGQVSALDQMEIKPDVSGELAALYVTKDREVKTGQLLAVINDRDAKRAQNDAEISLESARIKLDELLDGPDRQDALEAENALKQAERDLEKAQRTSDNILADSEKTLKNAYENGYNNVSGAFFKLSAYMKNLQEAQKAEQGAQDQINAYKMILGRDSPLVQRFLDDYNTADGLYDETFAFFGETFRDSQRNAVEKLIRDTLETTKAISRAQESARHMYDAIVLASYKEFTISSYVDKMKPKIESDLSSAFSLVSSLGQIIDTIDETLENTPDKIKDAELALKSAEEKSEAKKTALEKIKAGPDPLDIRTQKNIVAQKENALADAKAKLSDHYIYAPLSGLAAQVNSALKKGDFVSAGSSLSTIVTKQKIAEIILNEIDIAQVKNGQKATLTFDAIPELTLTGTVAEVDALGTISQGIVTYKVKIVFDSQDERVKSAMSVSASIIVEAKPDTLLIPNSAVKSQGETNYVEITEGNNIDSSGGAANISGAILQNAPRRQTIEIGLSNDEFTEILGGLKEGDAIITRTLQPGSAQTQTQSSRSGFQIPGLTGGSGGGMRTR